MVLLPAGPPSTDCLVILIDLGRGAFLRADLSFPQNHKRFTDLGQVSYG